MKTNRIPFTLEEYQGGKYKVVTRAGQSDVVTSSKIDEKCLGKCEYMELFKSLINKKS